MADKPETQMLLLELEPEMAREVTAEIYAIFQKRELSTALALGMLAYVTAYVMRTKLTEDQEVFKHNIKEFVRILMEVYSNLENAVEKKTVN